MSDSVVETQTIIVGASAAGLAVAACLKREGVPFILLEQSDQVGAAWRRHYDRLHLHTSRMFSGLPYLPMPRDYPRYPSRLQVIAYLEQYAAFHGLTPRFGQTVQSVERVDGQWETRTQDAVYHSRCVVMAAGYNRKPVIPHWQDEEAYQGEVLHSSAYHNGAPYRDKDVLVVGFGNSGGEIAIDLHEHGARPSMAVRSPVNILPRDILGIPILALGILLDPLPPRLADALGAPVRRLAVSDLSKWGLRRQTYGPNEQIKQHRRIPLLDVGTVQLIREGTIKVYPGIERFTPDGVVFTDGRSARFDVVILATGYTPDIASLLKRADSVVDEKGVPLKSGAATALPGLYFCGYYVSPTGMLREISIDAKRIARAISSKSA